MEREGNERVRVTGARGKPPTDTYKVSATYAEGFRAIGTLTITGFEAAAKAKRSGEAILERTRAIFRKHGLADYSAVDLSVLGTAAGYGPHARAQDLQEAVMRLAVSHADKKALEIFVREISPAGTSWSPGTTGSLNAGRPNVSPQIKQFAFLLPKSSAAARVSLDGKGEEVPVPHGESTPLARAPDADSNGPKPPADAVTVPLIRIAHGRSGDKGDNSNVGIIARRPEYLPWIRSQVTADAVREYVGHLVQGNVTRYSLPGIGALNFVLERALGGGGMASLRNDPLGKGMAQLVLAMPVRVPKELL
jgi:hypothetical protein